MIILIINVNINVIFLELLYTMLMVITSLHREFLLEMKEMGAPPCDM